MSRCLGLDPYGGKIEILDRFIRVGFNVKVNPADESCLFTVFESKEEKYKRWEVESGIKMPGK